MEELLTLVEAAERTDTSKVTVRRYLDAGRFPNAVREQGRRDGRWLVPASDLWASGIGKRKSSLPTKPMSRPEAVHHSDDDAVVAAQAETILRQAKTIEQLTALVAQLSGGAS